MSAQLPLIQLPPTLTQRQAQVLAAATQAGHEGITPEDAGAIAHELKEGRWSHSRETRCDYCHRDGHAILKALRRKGHVRYRAKLKVWQAVALPPRAVEAQPDHHGEGPTPYNAFPAGF